MKNQTPYRLESKPPAEPNGFDRMERLIQVLAALGVVLALVYLAH